MWRIVVSGQACDLMDGKAEVTVAAFAAPAVLAAGNPPIMREDRPVLAAPAPAAGRMSLWEIDIASRVVSAAPVCATIFGPTDRPDTIAYDTLVEAIHPDDRLAYRHEIARAVTLGRDVDVEFRQVRPDGRTSWARAIGCIDHDATGTPCRVIGLLLDVTARHEVEDRRH